MNALTQTEAKKIARGVKMLDFVNPNWFTKVDPGKFDLDDPTICVLGNVYGDYFAALHEVADQGVAKIIEQSGLKFTSLPENGKLDGNYYGFEASPSNKSAERMGQAWLHAVALRTKRAARRRAAKQ